MCSNKYERIKMHLSPCTPTVSLWVSLLYWPNWSAYVSMESPRVGYTFSYLLTPPPIRCTRQYLPDAACMASCCIRSLVCVYSTGSLGTAQWYNGRFQNCSIRHDLNNLTESLRSDEKKDQHEDVSTVSCRWMLFLGIPCQSTISDGGSCQFLRVR